MLEAHGVSSDLHQADAGIVARAGYPRTVAVREYPLTGLLTVFPR
jgi:hypothetical protein